MQIYLNLYNQLHQIIMHKITKEQSKINAVTLIPVTNLASFTGARVKCDKIWASWW